jgi:regulator of cell morphogenesis and NO signaling
MMESEHEEAGEILVELSELTNSYTAPSGACNSFQFLYKKLKELEDDLHQHIHLENNILFPKALQLEKELRNK